MVKKKVVMKKEVVLNEVVLKKAVKKVFDNEVFKEVLKDLMLKLWLDLVARIKSGNSSVYRYITEMIFIHLWSFPLEGKSLLS